MLGLWARRLAGAVAGQDVEGLAHVTINARAQGEVGVEVAAEEWASSGFSGTSSVVCTASGLSTSKGVSCGTLKCNSHFSCPCHHQGTSTRRRPDRIRCASLSREHRHRTPARWSSFISSSSSHVVEQKQGDRLRRARAPARRRNNQLSVSTGLQYVCSILRI